MVNNLKTTGQNISATLKKSIIYFQNEARQKTLEFVLSRQNNEGAFRGKSVEGDLYYTYFGCELLRALDTKDDVNSWMKKTAVFLSKMNHADQDYVHLISFIRSLAILNENGLSRQEKKYFSTLLKKYRTPDGGYSRYPHSEEGNSYDTFLFLTISQELGHGLFSKAPLISTRIIPSLTSTPDERDQLAPTPVLASQLMILSVLAGKKAREKGEKIREILLSRMNSKGGFYANPGAGLPDLLSTGVALFALKSTGSINFPTAEVSMDFIESCAHKTGGFFANPLDSEPDVEYTFYGLLALGSLIP